MGRSILAVAIGAILAFMVVALVEVVGHQIYPPPPGLDPYDIAAMKDMMAQMPAGGLWMVALAWFLGTAVGAWFAAGFALRAPGVHACIVGGLLLAAGLFNLVMLPHPAWFWLVGLAAFPLGVVVGLMLARRR